MNVHTSNLDIEKFRKVHALMKGGATEGERAAAKNRCSAMAKKAGMTLDQAVSNLDGQKPSKPANIFEGFSDWMEAKEPGYKAQRAKEFAERESRNDIRRKEILAHYGSDKALFARSALEEILLEAVAPLVDEWGSWTDEDGTEHEFPVVIDGHKPKFICWYMDDITPAIREAILSALPIPTRLADVLKELKSWDQLRWDRGLFCSSGEWNAYPEVECRFALLEHALEQGQPAVTWDDVQARFAWKRYAFERTWIDPTEREDAFMDRLEEDINNLRKQNENTGVQSGQPETSTASEIRNQSRSNADIRKAVMSMLDTHPELSDREISRRVGVSPQTVGNWRKRVSA